MLLYVYGIPGEFCILWTELHHIGHVAQNYIYILYTYIYIIIIQLRIHTMVIAQP